MERVGGSGCEKRRAGGKMRCCGRRCLTKTCNSGLLFVRKRMNECGSRLVVVG
jgi:hypothetical protein